MNIAILSPSNDAYSETFIQAHKKKLNGIVRYYYGTRDDQYLDGSGPLLKGLARFSGKVIEKLIAKPGHASDKALIASWKANNIQVVLAEYGTTGAEYLDVIKEANLPVVVHFHGFDASMHRVLSEYEDRYRKMFDYASYIVVVSSVMYDTLLSLGCPDRKLILNIYGPDPLFHDLTPSLSSQQFISVGRFTDKKAPHHTIKAFSAVLQEFPHARLVMAGTGDLLEECQNLVKEAGITESVEFPGVITPAQFSEYLESSLAFVQHSITAENGDMEGTPLTILESSASGLPVISTIHAGIPDVIKHGITGYLVAENDVGAMSTYMSKVLSDQKNAKKMGQLGRENIVTNFSLRRHIDKLDELLELSVGRGTKDS